jgi:ethanolamine utilization protein EutQ
MKQSSQDVMLHPERKGSSMKKRFLTADMIRARYSEGFRQIALEEGDVLTPLAQDTARELGMQVGNVGAILAVGAPVGANGHGNGKVEALTVAVVAPAATSATEPAIPGLDLEPLIRKVVMTCLARMGGSGAASETPVKRVGAQSYKMKPFPFEINRPEMDVQLVDVITAEHGSPMAAGFLSFHKGSFPWTLTYDEIEFVLEGEIHIGTAQGTVVGKPGDVLYIPKGTQITFGTPGWAKILYVTYPAEWAG